MKLMFIGWFSLMVVAPRPLAFFLAEKLFFPEKRAGLNRIIKIWHIPSR
jgi:hypothetical protein